MSELVRSTVKGLYNLYMETDAEAWRKIPQPRLLSSEQLAAAIEALRLAELPKHKSIPPARDKDVKATEAGDWEAFIGQGIACKILEGETKYYGKEIPDETLDIYRQLINQARAVLLDQVAKQTEATYDLLDKFHAVYGELKHRTHSLRFEDITRALAHNDRLGEIDRQHFRLDTAITHLLLDEFQDTSLPQWHVLRPFAKYVTRPPNPSAAAASCGSGPSFFCVGDVKQAIYGWRGGKSEIFDALEFELDSLTEESLTRSYRSSQPVIDTVNLVFTRLTRHPNLDRFQDAVGAWCSKFQEHTTHKKLLLGYAELCTAPEAGDDEHPESVKLRYAAQRIKQLVLDAPGHSIGVLTRTNDVVAQLIYELRRLRVPASEEGGNPLTDSPSVQLVLSLLKLADHPGDTVARFHLAQSPIAAAIEYPDHTNLPRTLGLASEVRSQLLHSGYGPAVQRWAALIEPSCDRRERSRLEQLVELAYGYEELATLRTSDFLRYVEGQRVADPTTAEVRVMTVHQAKGLQFEIVVLPDLETDLQGHTPQVVVGQPSPTERIDCVCRYRNASIQSLLPPELRELFVKATTQSVNESLCVLYVSLTRAIHALHMIVTPSAKNEKNLRKSSAGLLRAALTDGQPLAGEETPFCVGDPHWYGALPVQAAGKVPPPPSPPVEEIQLARASAGASMEHTAPSQLEGGARVRAARVLDLATAYATARGTLIHALFEQITWLDDQSIDWPRMRRVAESLNALNQDIDQQLETFQQMLAMPEIASVLRWTFYQPPRDADWQQILPPEIADATFRVEVHNERRFAVRDDGRLLSGVIDRLVLLYHGNQLVAAEVIDYKTDAASRDDAASVDALVEYYRPQLAAYRRAVARMYRLPVGQIGARLLFLSPGVTRVVAP